MKLKHLLTLAAFALIGGSAWGQTAPEWEHKADVLSSTTTVETLSDFTFVSTEFTIDMSVTSGTEVKVPVTKYTYATYTPTITGTLRLVYSNNKAYIYEKATGAAAFGYKAEASLTSITYPTMDDASVNASTNLLGDPDFNNTDGGSKGTGQYKLGTPWETDQDFGTTAGGFRVGSNNNAHETTQPNILVWRTDDAKSGYRYKSFGQKVSLEANSKYKFYIKVAENTNGPGKYSIRLGSALGSDAYSKVAITVSTDTKKTYNGELTTPAELESNSYFSWYNYDAYSKADNNSCCQIDYIILSEATRAQGIIGATNAVYVDGAYGPELTQADVDALNAAIEAASAVSGDMQQSLEDDLSAKLEAARNVSMAHDVVVEATSNLVDATTAAQTSVNGYASVKGAYEWFAAEIANTNVYNTTELTNAQNLYATYTAKTATYNAADVTYFKPTLRDYNWANNDDAANMKATALYKILVSEETAGTANYVLNTWSTEGDNKSSNMIIPFVQNWTEDGNSLATSTYAYNMSELENGLYEVSALVRVRIKNNQGDNPATGITLQGNDGKAMSVCGGETCTDGGQFRYGTFTAKCNVTDGNLAVKFNIAEDNNISWLAFKNVKYTRLGDVAYDAESVTLNETALNLKISNNAAKLTATVAPAEAIQDVIWTSSDVNVATVDEDGNVTGIAPGHATITVKVASNEEITATCEVTTTYSESVVPATASFVDGTKKTIYTLSSTNLITNGSFEYGNGTYAWRAANGNAMTSNNFDVVEDNDNHYLKAKVHKGGSDAGSIATGWNIEAGKTYVFGYRTKSDVQGNTEYHKVSLTNTIGTETTVISDNNKVVGTDWTNIEYVFTNEDNTYVQFCGRWLGGNTYFDDFYLAEVTETTETGNVDYLNDYIAEVSRTNVGDGAFQIPSSLKTAVDEAIATNKRMIEAGTATEEEVVNGAQAYTEAKTALLADDIELNVPEEGDKFHIAITYNGYRYHNHALEANATPTSGVTVPLADNTTNNNYPNDWTFTPVEGTKNGYTMSITTATGTYFVCTGSQDNGTNEQQIRMTTDPAKALTIVIKLTVDDGVYNLLNTRNNNTTIGCQDDKNANGGWYTVNSHNTHTITPAVKASANLKVSAAKYGTFIAPFNAKIPEGVKVYQPTLNGNTIVPGDEKSSIVANTPYLVCGDGENDINEDLEGWGLAIKDTYEDGILVGMYTDNATIPANSYVLQTQNDKQAFYKVTTTENFLGTANRCYLVAPSNARVLDFVFDGEETSISNLNASNTNVNGKFIEGNQIVIVKNGKKYNVAGQIIK